MAEAAVDLSSNMSTLRYFCHQCSQESDSVLSDFTCPRCRSGFVEEVNQEDSHDINRTLESDDMNDSDQQMADILDDLYGTQRGPQRNMGSRTNGAAVRQPGVGPEAGSARRQRHSANDPQRRQTTRYFQVNFPRNPDSTAFDSTQSLEGLFQHILTNVTSGQLTPRDGGINARGLINIDFPLPLFQVLHGNPGDYAWGEGGLNEIITQLLNQLDGSGPPPMPKEDIDKVPFVSVTPQQVEKNTQCTVCMEDFKTAEKVRILECSHCYHNECIVPWLQMVSLIDCHQNSPFNSYGPKHATCPVCRKEFQTTRNSNRETVSANTNNDPLIGNRSLPPMPDTSDMNTNTQSSNHSTYESTDDYD